MGPARLGNTGDGSASRPVGPPRGGWGRLEAPGHSSWDGETGPGAPGPTFRCSTRSVLIGVWAGAACPRDLASGEMNHVGAPARFTCSHLAQASCTPHRVWRAFIPPPPIQMGRAFGLTPAKWKGSAHLGVLGNVVVCAHVLPHLHPARCAGIVWKPQVQLCPHGANSLIGCRVQNG